MKEIYDLSEEQVFSLIKEYTSHKEEYGGYENFQLYLKISKNDGKFQLTDLMKIGHSVGEYVNFMSYFSDKINDLRRGIALLPNSKNFYESENYKKCLGHFDVAVSFLMREVYEMQKELIEEKTKM